MAHGGRLQWQFIQFNNRYDDRSTCAGKANKGRPHGGRVGAAYLNGGGTSFSETYDDYTTDKEYSMRCHPDALSRKTTLTARPCPPLPPSSSSPQYHFDGDPLRPPCYSQRSHVHQPTLRRRSRPRCTFLLHPRKQQAVSLTELATACLLYLATAIHFLGMDSLTLAYRPLPESVPAAYLNAVSWPLGSPPTYCGITARAPCTGIRTPHTRFIFAFRYLPSWASKAQAQVTMGQNLQARSTRPGTRKALCGVGGIYLAFEAEERCAFGAKSIGAVARTRLDRHQSYHDYEHLTS
ncbi:hypothetical protein PENSPDRAFT_739522 [Peniophora sp. CONT]|nr:hypothetical protein PENSPDRAFT_739522 [Peniophora sp. CONT]